MKKISPLHLHRLCHYQSHHFKIQFPLSDSLVTFVCLLYPSLKTFFSLFQIVFLLLVFLTAIRISSPDTPPTPSCKEKLLIALHNSLLSCLLDIWQRNILVFDEEWAGRLLNFPTLVCCGKNF